MLSDLWKKIKPNAVSAVAILVGVAVLVFSIINPQWWGDRAFGVLIGATVITTLFVCVYLLDTLKSFDTVAHLPALILVGSVATAFIVRLRIGGGAVRSPLQLSITMPSNQAILLVTFCIAMFALLIAFVRALARGEGVSFESHWGGLGGGISGWKISSALIYLLGMVFLLLFSSVIAWRIFVQTTQQAPTTNPVATATQNP